MQIKVEYSGYFYKELPKLLMIKDDFSLGQKLTLIEKESKKRFISMSDEEIYNTLKSLIDTRDYYLDELPDENFWVNFLK